MPGSKDRVEYLEGAARTEGERKALRTSYELTKGGRLRWEPKDGEVPVLGKSGIRAIKQGMQRYYGDMIALRPDDLMHLEDVHTYMGSEKDSRESKLNALQGRGNTLLLESFPSDHRLRRLAEEHLTAEHEALDAMHAELGERIRAMKKAKETSE